MEKVVIKAVPNPENPQLALKYVGAKDYITPGTGPDGKIITGLDENALDIIRMEDAGEKKKLQASIKKEREELERLLGRELDVTSDFWDEFFFIVEDGVTLDPTNPMHRVVEKFLIANKKVAPNEEAIEDSEGEYSNCLFFFYREEEEVDKTAKNSLKKDRAVAKLVNVNENSPERLVKIYSYLFGYDAKNEVSPTQAYVKIKEMLDVTDKNTLTQNIEKVLAVLNLKPEELNTKLVLDKAIKKRIVTTKGNIYRRGDIILGNDYDEALDYLMSPENSAELVSLKKEVDKA